MTDCCVIFAGGEPVSADTIDRECVENAYVICADKGLLLAQSLGIVPDLILGDFDSLEYTPQGNNVMSYPVEKDDTDLMLAINMGLKEGFSTFTIYGACGGRLDHMIGNIECLALLVKNGASGEIVGDNERIRLLTPGVHSVKRKVGFSMSLFAYSAEVTGLSISGTKYTTDKATLKKASTLGVSNVITDDNARISFDSGILMIIESRLEQ